MDVVVDVDLDMDVVADPVALILFSETDATLGTVFWVWCDMWMMPQTCPRNVSDNASDNAPDDAPDMPQTYYPPISPPMSPPYMIYQETNFSGDVFPIFN